MKEKEKTIFSKKSSAGKGDKPRRGIEISEWGKKFDKIFKKNKKKS